MPLDQETRARRREARISAGVDDLQRWLADVARAGLAEAAARPWSSYEQMSARLVDAQAPGLARFVRGLGGLPHTAPDWPERMLIDIGQLSLLLDAWRRLDALEPDLQAEVRGLVGINESREAVLSRPPIHDVWDVVGRRILDGERMRVQRTWLWGQRTQRWALLLDFAVGGQSIQPRVAPGTSVEADLCFYSGAVRLRAIPNDAQVCIGTVTRLPSEAVSGLLTSYAQALARNPWLERMPGALGNMVIQRGPHESWWARDEHDAGLRLAGAAGWHLLALSGGAPLDLFGEWDGFSFRPLSTLVGERLVLLPEVTAA